MNEKHFQDKKLHGLLEKVDQESAESCKQMGCQVCHGKLHKADYDRKPRGGPKWDKRYSFCCSEEGCRKRHTPPSVRFLGRRVYVGFVVVLLAAMTHGLNPQRIRRLREILRVDTRTLKRWRQWWLEDFAQSLFWKEHRSCFMPMICEANMPLSLCEVFEVDEPISLVKLLEFLAPLSCV